MVLVFKSPNFWSVFTHIIHKSRYVSSNSRVCIPSFSKCRFSNMSQSWQPPPPCRIGDSISAIYTPALVFDVDKLSNNLKCMSDSVEQYPGVAIRPHAKAHKSPNISALQVEHGAVGVCCQTLVETEAMVYGAGINDILVSNQLIGKAKLRRLAKVAQLCKISICVDDPKNISDISEVAHEIGATIDCVVEVDVGQQRCGVRPGRPAVDLAKFIMELPNITFKGIQCYQGWNQHIRKVADRNQAVDIVISKTRETLQAFHEADVSCSYVTGGVPVHTRTKQKVMYLQKYNLYGSYVFMDVDYGKNLDLSGNFVKDFDQSLYVLGTIQSVNGDSWAVVDAGMKAVSMDSGEPTIVERPNTVYHIGGDEHGILKPGTDYKVGDMVWLVPGHCDPTVNLYDWLIGIRDGKVEKLWPVLGRGPGV